MTLKLVTLLLILLSPKAFALVDESRDINAVLENGTLSEKDCLALKAGKSDRETVLRCGKWMFFYDSMNRPGMPAQIVDLIRKNAPYYAGQSLERFGLYKDPFSKNKLPIGLVPAAKLVLGVPSYAQTCASCHFAQLPDGRYKVGHPNSKFDFNALQLTVNLIPQIAMQKNKVLPRPAELKLRPLFDEFFGAKWSRPAIVLETLKLIPTAITLKQKPLTDEQITYLASMDPGVLDPIATPSVEDGYPTPIRILPLWGLPKKEDMEAAGSTHGAMLTSNGGTPDLDHVYVTGSKIVDNLFGTKLSQEIDPVRFGALTEYIYSLRVPKNLKPLDSAAIARGKTHFQRSCQSCHNGPGYAGTQLYDFAEVGTDSQMAQIYAPDELIPNRVVADYELTRKVKASRLEGWWSLTQFLHNGSVKAYPDLLCTSGPRLNDSPIGLSNRGHTYGCDDLNTEEKADLIEFLHSI